MFSKLILVTLAICFVTSNCVPATYRLNEPKRCCIPRIFSAQISTSSGGQLPDGSTFVSYGHFNFSYDESRGLFAMKGVEYSAPDQKQTHLWIIERDSDRKTFTINLDSKECQESTNPIAPFRCVPDSAVYLHSSTYGYGDKQIVGDTWLVQLENVISYLSVSRDGLCIPFAGTTFAANPPFLSALTVTDFTAKVIDPSVFHIPAECNKIA